MHVHLFSKEMAWPAGPGISNKDWFFPLFVANGVTGVRDMHTDPGEIKLAAEWNQQRVAGRMIGPAVAVSSRMVDGVRPTPGALEVTTAAEARQEVRPERHMGRAHRLGRARSICERRREPE